MLSLVKCMFLLVKCVCIIVLNVLTIFTVMKFCCKKIVSYNIKSNALSNTCFLPKVLYSYSARSCDVPTEKNLKSFKALVKSRLMFLLTFTRMAYLDL